MPSVAHNMSTGLHRGGFGGLVGGLGLGFWFLGLGALGGVDGLCQGVTRLYRHCTATRCSALAQGTSSADTPEQPRRSAGGVQLQTKLQHVSGDEGFTCVTEPHTEIYTHTECNQINAIPVALQA